MVMFLLSECILNSKEVKSRLIRGYIAVLDY